MSISTPYGLKSLLECLSRATLLAQPDDIPKFLSTHLKEMIHTRGIYQGHDTKELAFQYQEQWENIFCQKGRTQTLNPSVGEFPSSTCNKSTKASEFLMVSHPNEAGEKTDNKSSLRILSQCPYIEVDPFPHEPPTPPKGKMYEAAIPSNIQRAHVSKQGQGKKSAKMPSCRLSDCPYHDNYTEKLLATMESGAVGASIKSETTIDPELLKSKAEPPLYDLPFPYRPRGGYLIDPELVPERVRIEPVANSLTTAAESALLCSNHAAPYRRQDKLHQRTPEDTKFDLGHQQVSENTLHL